MSPGEPTTPPSGPDSAAAPQTASTASAGTAWTATSWPAQAADLVVDVVQTVRDRTTAPLQTIARGIVYGTAIVFLAVTAVVLLIIGLVRFVDNYLPGEVWATYLLLGSVSFVAGLIVWATRRPRETA